MPVSPFIYFHCNFFLLSQHNISLNVSIALVSAYTFGQNLDSFLFINISFSFADNHTYKILGSLRRIPPRNGGLARQPQDGDDAAATARRQLPDRTTRHPVEPPPLVRHLPRPTHLLQRMPRCAFRSDLPRTQLRSLQVQGPQTMRCQVHRQLQMDDAGECGEGHHRAGGRDHHAASVDGGQPTRLVRLCRLQKDLRIGPAPPGLAVSLVPGNCTCGMPSADGGSMSDWTR